MPIHGQAPPFFRCCKFLLLLPRLSSATPVFRHVSLQSRVLSTAPLLFRYSRHHLFQRPSDLTSEKAISSMVPIIIEHLWCQLDELIKSGHMVDQCDKLKKLLHGALLNLLKLQLHTLKEHVDHQKKCAGEEKKRMEEALVTESQKRIELSNRLEEAMAIIATLQGHDIVLRHHYML